MKEAILTQSPLPENIDTVKELDDFFKDLLKEKRKTNEQNLENIFERDCKIKRDMLWVH